MEERAPGRAARQLGLVMALATALAGCGGGEEGPSAPGLSQPALREVSPSRVLPGQAVTLTGSSFGEDPARVRVTFGGIPGVLLSVSQASIRAVVPPDIEPGEVQVRVETDGIAATTAVTLTVVPPAPPFSTVSAGSAFTCGVARDGGAFCWGFGTDGQLGSGTAPNHVPAPLPIAASGPFTMVSAGNLHACGVTAGGAALCWGKNENGQLGDGTALSSLTPVLVAGGLAFSSVSAGTFYTCGLTSGGAAYCWGRNRSGQLGDGTSTSSSAPVPVAGGLTFRALSAGGSHTCGLTAGGQAYCWGQNSHGELGDGTTTGSSAPVPVAGGIAFSSLAAGRATPNPPPSVGEHTCGLTPAGAAYCWGFNAGGQLGDGTRSESRQPVPVLTDLAFASIATGAFHTCALTGAGEAFCWGANDSGQLGSTPAGGSLNRPVPVLGGLRFTAVSAGGAGKSAIRAVRSHTCALTPEGVAYCWGQNDSGQLGTGEVSGVEAILVPVTAGP